MHVRLKKIYVALLAPAVVGLIAASVLQQFRLTIRLPAQAMAAAAPAIFMLAAVFALAGPIFYRALFAHRQRNRARVSPAVLYRHERNLTGMALVTPYLAMVGVFLQLPRFYLAATLLLALYALYYYYPSERRVLFDMSIYRAGKVKPADRINPHDAQ